MLRFILSIGLISSLVWGADYCAADGPADQGTAEIVVANQRLLDLIVTWVDLPVECLFDPKGLLDDDADASILPALPIASMLDAKCFVYCPGDESPIEAIYRERMSNHGVKVIPIALPSSLPYWKRIEESQKQSLLAGIQ